jgi:hypothetical protein
MTTPRVVLTQLSERTSARGTRYFAGYLGKSSVVLFADSEPDTYGDPRWSLYVSEPQPRAEGPQIANHAGGPNVQVPYPDRREGLAGGARQRGEGWRGQSYRRPNRAVPTGPLEELNDTLEDIGR